MIPRNQVEDENELLRKTAGLDRPPSMPGESNEDYLRSMVGDLVRQKSQLTDHIAMVTKENQQLWSRLSNLTKENSSLGMSITKIRDAINNTPVASKNNNLIRSKTFTRRPAAAKEEESATAAAEENMSLEEISLQIINKLVEGKENFEHKCGEILDTTTENLCFGFKDSSRPPAAAKTGELADTVEKCTSDATAMKQALLQQQGHLKQLIKALSQSKSEESVVDLLVIIINLLLLAEPICDDCMKQPVIVKSVDSQTRPEFTNNDDLTNNIVQDGDPSALRSSDRTCPMCGKHYSKSEDFEIFQRHVEWHFIDESNNETDLSIISMTAQQNF